MLPKKLFDDVTGSRKPGHMIVVNPGAPQRIVSRVSHEQGGTTHDQFRTQLFVSDEHPRGMKPGAPVVGVAEAPFQHRHFDLWMPRRADVLPELHEVILNSLHTGLKIVVFVLVIVTAQDVEIVTGNVHELFAPLLVVRTLLSARDDSCAWR